MNECQIGSAPKREHLPEIDASTLPPPLPARRSIRNPATAAADDTERPFILISRIQNGVGRAASFLRRTTARGLKQAGKVAARNAELLVGWMLWTTLSLISMIGFVSLVAILVMQLTWTNENAKGVTKHAVMAGQILELLVVLVLCTLVHINKSRNFSLGLIARLKFTFVGVCLLAFAYFTRYNWTMLAMHHKKLVKLSLSDGIETNFIARGLREIVKFTSFAARIVAFVLIAW
ncbi:hypothetical protein EV182_005898, partial [Spiromyces aspiralis]